MTEKIIRSCIVCGSDAHTPVFTFTWDFLTKVRWSAENELRPYGWDEQTTSTIVRCDSCGCCYTRDVVPYPDVSTLETPPSNHDDTGPEIENLRHYTKYDQAYWTIRTLVKLATLQQKRAIRFLDYGAGAGAICNIARALGVGVVVAYDPFSPPGADDYRARNFPGIRHVREPSELEALGPFDAVACQSVIEHVLSPRQEMESIHRLMSPGGLLYINNPYMPLEKELPALKAAKKIVKRDLISYYHQHHFNYMLPRHFEKLVRDIGFDLTALTYFPPAPFAPGTRREWLRQELKSLYRGLQHSLSIDYGRQFYILKK